MDDIEILRMVFDEGPLGIVVLDPSYRIVEVNSCLCDILGYTQSELTELTFPELTHPEDISRDVALAARLFRGEIPSYVVEKRCIRKDGTIVWARFHASVVRNERGEPEFQLGMVEDFTKQKSVEQSLQSREEERYRALCELTSNAVLTTDIDGAVIDANTVASDLLGYTVDELIGLTIPDDIVAPEVLDETKRAFQEQLEEHGRFLAKTIWMHKDGSPVPVAVSGKPLVLGDQQQLQIIGRDITASKKAEEALRARGRQQAAVSELGLRALEPAPLDALMKEAVTILTDVLNVEYAKVLELQPGGESFLLRSGVGWKPGQVGKAVVETKARSQAGYTLMSGQPVVVPNFEDEKRFIAPPLLVEHDVVAGMSVVIYSQGEQYGVLGVHAQTPTAFSQDNVSFLQGIANVLGSAIERERNEQSLRTSEARYRSLYELASDAFLSILPNGEIIDANFAASDLLGYTADELKGLRVYDKIVAPDVAEAAERTWSEQIEERGQALIDTTWVRKDGSRVPIAVSGKSITVGSQQQFQLIGRDITESKKAEGELRKSEGLFRQLAEASQAAIFIVADPKIMYANPAAETLSGRPLSELLTIGLREIIHPEDREEVLDRISRRIRGEDVPAGSRQRVLQPSGDVRWVEASTTPIDFDGVPAVLAVIIDVTNLVQAEEATQRAREELEGKVEQRMLRKNPYKLTFRELTVLHHVATGKADKEIATELGISPLTAQNHVRHILTKMDAGSRTNAGVRAVREGLVD